MTLDTRFASESDYRECKTLHKKFGTTYYFASRRFPAETRKKVDALYGFVRTADEWVDRPPAERSDARHLLSDFRTEMQSGFEGTTPRHPVLRAFCDTVRESRIDQSEPHLFLDAMQMDLDRDRYETFAELCEYMRGSAAAVGLMMCAILNVEVDEDVHDAACDLGNAMQLTNFLRDIREDYEIFGRIYLPQEDLRNFGVHEQDIADRSVDDRFVELMQFQIARARDLYARSLAGVERLPKDARWPVLLAHELYGKILDKIEENNYDVFASRARTSRWEKLKVALGPARLR